MFSVFEFG